MRSKSAKRILLAALACALLAAVLPAAALASAEVPTQTGGAAPQPLTSGSGAAELNLRHSGLATWFGPGFYGHKTACGQVLEPTLVGVANRTLACGTLVEVSYFGHHLTIPVVDRGPYGRLGADWDLTSGAAKALKITETVRVHAHIVGRVANSPTLGLPAQASAPAPSLAPAVTGGASAS